MTARTLFLNHSATIGGAELCLLDVATHLRANSIVVLLEDGPFRERLEAHGIRVQIVDAGAMHSVRRDSKVPGAQALLAVVRAAKAVARIARDFDVIHANSQKALVVGSIASVRSRTPLVWHLHDIIEPPWFSQLNIKADVLLANNVVTRVIGVSHATVDAFVRQGGRADKAHVVHNGIDAGAFSASDVDAERARAALGLSDVPVAGCFSRLAEWKGQHVLIDAASRIPSLHVLLVGGPLFGEQRYERRLHEQVNTLGMRDRVHFLGQRPDVATLMRTVDLVVHPSTAPEPFARTLIEAMLVGHAPIASACGGVVELIENESTGLLFTPGDSVELCSLLEDALAMPDRMRAMAAAASDNARCNFSGDTFVSAIAAHLDAAA